MVKGTTKTGFEFEIPKEKFNDWMLLKNLRNIDRGELECVVDVAEFLFDDKLYTLENHVLRINGKVTIDGMISELQNIMDFSDESKN